MNKQPFIANTEDALSPEDVLEEEYDLGLDGLDGTFENEDGEDEDYGDGLGYVGLGRLRRRGRRKSRRSRGRKRGRARAGRRRRRRSRKVRAAVAAPKKRRRGRRRRKSARTVVKVVTAPAVRRARRSRGRRRKSRHLSGVGQGGFSRALGKLADTVALQSISGLGAGRKRKSRRRRSRRSRGRARARGRIRRARKGGRKRTRRSRGRRRGGRRVSGLGWRIGSLGRMGATLADAEVAASWPVLGPLQYLFSAPGLEAIGGVTLSSFLFGVVQEGLFAKMLMKENPYGTLGTIGSGLVTSIAVWELGRLLGSGNLAKFGAYFALGKVVESQLIKPYVLKKIFAGMQGWGLGQARVPEEQELRDVSYLAQARVPEEQELRDVGQRIVTEEELLGDDVGAEADEESAMF